MNCRFSYFVTILSMLTTALAAQAAGQETSFMTNVYGRDYQLLNGKWNAIVDLYDQGEKMKVYENRTPRTNEEFFEYSFEGGLRLNVPGDWNSQLPELKYYEGTVWYARHFEADPRPGERQFLYFGAVSYRCKVYLNGEKIAEHEGGFTPFETELTGKLKDGDNFLTVMVNNRRTTDAIPALAFDWWNYGGITRDVMLVTVPDQYVRDYFAYGYIGGRAVKTEDVTLAVECAFTDDAEALNRLSGSEVLRTAEPREGELSGAVSHKFAETAGADAGDTVKLCVEGTPLDYEGTGYVTVRITSVFNSTGFYYTNGGSEKIVIDYSELEGKVATRRFGNFLIYLREPDADVEVSAVEKAVREITGNKLTVYIADGYAKNAIEDSVSGSMETLSIGVAAVTMLMAVMIYFSYSVIARNRTEELVKFKASGATPAQSIAIMYAEVCVYVFTGGVTGLAAGTGVLKLAENILRAQVAGITVYAEAWKYALAFAVAAVAAFAACAPPAARMGYMSITALRSESVRFARRAPAWLAIASTVLFAGALTGLFFAEGDALMPMMIVFLVSTVIWAVATVPHVLSAAGALCERIFPKREANIAAMEMPVNAGVTTVAVMLSLVIAFVWTGYCIVDLVRMTSVPADARFTSDFVVPSYAVDVEAQNGILADYLAVDGITDVGALGEYSVSIEIRKVSG